MLLVVTALLLCHGFFGSLHLFNVGLSAGQAGAAETTASGMSFADEGAEREGSTDQITDREYYALVVVLILGLFVSLLQRTRYSCRVAPWPRSVSPRCLHVAYPVQAPTKSLLQVFRL